MVKYKDIELYLLLYIQEHEETFTTIWGADWYYIKNMQGIVNYESNTKQTPIYV